MQEPVSAQLNSSLTTHNINIISPKMASNRPILAMLLLLLRALVCHGRVPRDAAFVRTSASHFLLNGSPFLFNGFNAYWMMHVAANSGDRHKISDVFREASAAGLTVCRTWAFGDGGDGALQISPGTYDERVFQGLDFVISEAKRYGIRVILSFVNNYNDFGGKAQYRQWARSAGAQVNGDDDFYTHQLIKDYFKNHIRKVVTRLNTITRVAYRDDPTIMAWELMNEPRCQSDNSGRTINGWVEEMASFVKSLDTKHLLEVGMEGFYGDTTPERKQQVNPGYQVGTDFITSNLVREIDFATIHAYPDIWLLGKSEEEQMGFMERWMQNHWEDARNVLKKPLVVAEFGKSSKDAGFSVKEREAYMGNVYRDVYGYAVRSGGAMSGSLVWQVMAEGMDGYHDGYEIILSQTPSTAAVMATHSHAIRALMSSRAFTAHHHHHHGDGERNTSDHHHHARKSTP